MTISAIAETYLNLIQSHNRDDIAGLLSDDVTIEIPLSNTGDLRPWLTFSGKVAALDYVETIFSNFSQIRLLERATFVADDDRTVFVETIGDLLQRATQAAYRNRYVFKFTISEGRVVHLSEYANPVPFAKLMGIPLG